jgi:YfiH family protein
MTMPILSSPEFIVPDWPVPSGVGCLSTTRRGGVSQGAFSTLNLGAHVGDDPKAVAANRDIVRRSIGARPVWLNQVHGTRVVDAAEHRRDDVPPEADAACTRQTETACTVMTADCLPVLLCDDAGTVVAAAHAGWRGLLAGVLETSVAAMGVPGKSLMAWLGPAIGPQAFEVGDEVRTAFVAAASEAAPAFQSVAGGKWLADIYLLARQCLKEQGIERVFGGSFCTVTEADRFFSYRRDGQTGRMASMIWLKQ